MDPLVASLAWLRRAASLCTLLLAMGTTTLTYAQTGPSAQQRETARALMDKGDAAFAKGDYAGALEAQKAAHAIMNVPTTGLAVARAQAALGKLVEARNTALAVTRMPPGDPDPDAFKQARADAAKLAEELVSRIPTVVVKVKPVDAAGIKVTVDGEALLPVMLGQPYRVNPGSHTIVASADGRAEQKRSVTLAERAKQELVIELAPSGTAPMPTTPPPDTTPPDTTPPDSTPPDNTPPAEGGFTGMQTAGLVVGGVGVASVLVAAITGGLVLGKRGTIDEACNPTTKTCTQAGLDAIDSQNTLAAINTVAWGVGIVGVGAGVTMLLLGGGSDAPEQALVPVVTPDGGGAVLLGRF